MAELTPQACRAARALLDWRLADLAEATGLSIETLTQFENNGRPMRESNRAKIIKAFAAHGVIITNGEGTGAKLLSDRPAPPAKKKPAPKRTAKKAKK